jgi:hypothetical protein
MSDKKVDKQCIVCQNELDIGDAIYAVNVNLVDDLGDDWQGRPSDKLRIIFKNSKKPKGAMHRECWNVHIGNSIVENKKTTLTMNTNRLDSVD